MGVQKSTLKKVITLMRIRRKKFSQEKSHSWECCKNVNLVFPIMVIYNNIYVFLKNFPLGITAFGTLLEAKAVEVAEQLHLAV